MQKRHGMAREHHGNDQHLKRKHVGVFDEEEGSSTAG